tara:strand:+ start:504 stop:653 length:150 start_codon:yes stop_codon:yes gene_type:complete
MNIELKKKHLKEIKKLEQNSKTILNDIKNLQIRHSDIISRLQILTYKLK